MMCWDMFDEICLNCVHHEEREGMFWVVRVSSDDPGWSWLNIKVWCERVGLHHMS